MSQNKKNGVRSTPAASARPKPTRRILQVEIESMLSALAACEALADQFIASGKPPEPGALKVKFSDVACEGDRMMPEVVMINRLRTGEWTVTTRAGSFSIKSRKGAK